MRPEIGFKGFTDDWEQRKLGDFGKVMVGKCKGTLKISEVRRNLPVKSSMDSDF